MLGAADYHTLQEPGLYTLQKLLSKRMEPGSKTLSYYNVPLVTSTDKAFMPAGKKEKKLKTQIQSRQKERIWNWVSTLITNIPYKWAILDMLPSQIFS